MRRMVITAVIAAMVGFAHASQVAWSGTQIRDTANVLVGVNASAVAFTGTATDRAAILAILGSSSWEADFTTYMSGLVNSQTAAALSIGANSHVILGGFAVAQNSNVGSALGSPNAYGGAAAANSFVASSQQSVFVVVFDNSAWGDAAHYSVSALTTLTLGGTGTTTFSRGWANWGGTGVAGTWTEVVPEPTSMALLALGAAVVGLRRRFRK